MVKLIFGCGYLGKRVARRWLDVGDRVHAVTRSEARAAQFRRDGLLPIVADVMNGSTLTTLPRASSVLYCVGFDRATGQPVRDVCVEGLKAVLQSLPLSVERFLYVSTTGVYGQGHGGWVDESSACHPVRPSGAAYLEAEQALRSHGLGDRSVILRLAGIYGPGRIPRCEEIRQGRPVRAPRSGHLNLIHVDDAVTVIVAAEQKAKTPACYVVSDGRPVPRQEYCREVARWIGAPEVRFETPRPGSPPEQRATNNKRIRNTRMLAELGVTLTYPTYREGLASIMAGG